MRNSMREDTAEHSEIVRLKVVLVTITKVVRDTSSRLEFDD